MGGCHLAWEERPLRALRRHVVPVESPPRRSDLLLRVGFVELDVLSSLRRLGLAPGLGPEPGPLSSFSRLEPGCEPELGCLSFLRTLAVAGAPALAVRLVRSPPPLPVLP